LVFQIAIGLLAATTLDGGAILQLWSCAAAAYWVDLIWILFKRPHAPTKVDLFSLSSSRYSATSYGG
jgi:hypothetical protein